MIFAILVTVTCLPFEVEAHSGRCRLQGVLDSHAGETYRIRIDSDLTDGWQGRVVASGVVGAKGALDAEFALEVAQPAYLTVGRTLRLLWLAPGSMTVESSQDTWSFAGDGALENRCLEETGSGRPGIDVPMPKAFDPERYAALVTERTAERRAYLKQVAAEGMSRESPFVAYLDARFVGEAANAKATYPLLASMNGLVQSDDIPPSAYDFWDSFPLLDDRAAVRSPAYRLALDSSIEHRASARMRSSGVDPKSDRDAWLREHLIVQRQLLKNHPETDELLFACKIDFMIQYASAATTSGALADFRSRFPQSRYLDHLESLFAKTMHVDVAAIDERVAFLDVDGRRRKLADLRGRVVYIDFWGAWCRACLVQVPELEELAATLTDEDVVVLGVNMLDDRATWRATVESKSLPGEQWKPASSDDEATLTELVRLRAYPRFLLLDREGRVVSATAPPPADAEPAIRAALDRDR